MPSNAGEHSLGLGGAPEFTQKTCTGTPTGTRFELFAFESACPAGFYVIAGESGGLLERERERPADCNREPATRLRPPDASYQFGGTKIRAN